MINEFHYFVCKKCFNCVDMYKLRQCCKTEQEYKKICEQLQSKCSTCKEINLCSSCTLCYPYHVKYLLNEIEDIKAETDPFNFPF